MTTQSQIFLNRMTQDQLEITQRIYQDMSNVFGTLLDYKALKDSACDNSELQKMYLNRCINQLNLSNSIQVDDSYTASAKKINYREMKQNAQNIFYEVKRKFQNEFQQEFQDQELLNLLDIYEKNTLTNFPIQVQYQLHKIDHEPQFNQKVIQQILNSMNKQDDEYKQLINNYNNDPDFLRKLQNSENIYQTAKKRFINSKYKVNQMLQQTKSCIQIKNKNETRNPNTSESSINPSAKLNTLGNEIIIIFGAIHFYYTLQNETLQLDCARIIRHYVENFKQQTPQFQLQLDKFSQCFKNIELIQYYRNFIQQIDTTSAANKLVNYLNEKKHYYDQNFTLFFPTFAIQENLNYVIQNQFTIFNPLGQLNINIQYLFGAIHKFNTSHSVNQQQLILNMSFFIQLLINQEKQEKLFEQLNNLSIDESKFDLLIIHLMKLMRQPYKIQSIIDLLQKYSIEYSKNQIFEQFGDLYQSKIKYIILEEIKLFEQIYQKHQQQYEHPQKASFQLSFELQCRLKEQINYLKFQKQNSLIYFIEIFQKNQFILQPKQITKMIEQELNQYIFDLKKEINQI